MTASPKRTDDSDTYKHIGDPVYIYSLKDGINDGYPTPFNVRQISTGMDEYAYALNDAVVEGALELGRPYEKRDFKKITEIKAREAYRVSLFMGKIDQREKALVFCATQLHALAARDLINQESTTTSWLSRRLTTKHSSQGYWQTCGPGLLQRLVGVCPGYRTNELSSP